MTRSRSARFSSTKKIASLPHGSCIFALLISAFLILTFGRAASAQIVDIPTWRYDQTHSAANTKETLLTPANVNKATFGKLFSHSVDGYVYGQPLYISNLSMPDGKLHNVMFVVTEHDSVYAFDADDNVGKNASPLWKASMLDGAHGAPAGATSVPDTDVGADNIRPEIGITSTPVIDPVRQTIYVVAKSKESGAYVFRLHALSLLDGSERANSPRVLTASVAGKGRGSVGGIVSFNTLRANQRAALGLHHGRVYIAFASHSDIGSYHGWILEYDAISLQQISVACMSCVSSTGKTTGIWMSGAGMPIDSEGRLFVATANGDVTSYPPHSDSVSYGDSIVRFDISNGLKPTDAFTPYNQAALDSADDDQGSGGILLVPDQPGAHPHILIQSGKSGDIFVLDRDNLGGYAAGATSNRNALQDIQNAIGGGLRGSPAYWNGNVYFWGKNNPITAFHLKNGLLESAPFAKGAVTASEPNPTPVVTSNGTQNGIVWALRTDSSSTNEILYAYEANDVSKLLYTSEQDSARDSAGPRVKFQLPAITNGKVMVGGVKQVMVYGLLNGQHAAAPQFSPGGATYGSALSVTLSDTTPGATIYYAVNARPTRSSTVYTGPITVSSSETISAKASAPGYLDSAISSATYTILPHAAAPKISPVSGTYSSAVTVTLSDVTPGATIYYAINERPTRSSTVYTGAITISSSETISAKASAPGYSDSAISSATYTIGSH